jgi:hypothetical protein
VASAPIAGGFIVKNPANKTSGKTKINIRFI